AQRHPPRREPRGRGDDRAGHPPGPQRRQRRRPAPRLTPEPRMTPSAPRGRLLVVDDEVELMTALCESLREEGVEADGLAHPAAAPDALRAGEFDVLLSDLMMPGTDGIQLLREALQIDPHLVGVIMTGQGSIQTAVEAMKAGAFDYVLKPFRMQQVLPVLDRAMEVRRLRTENA